MNLDLQRDCHPSRPPEAAAKDLNLSAWHNVSVTSACPERSRRVLFLCALCVKSLLFAGRWPALSLPNGSPVTGH